MSVHDICPVCGASLIPTSSMYAGCPNGLDHCKLVQLPDPHRKINRRAEEKLAKKIGKAIARYNQIVDRMERKQGKGR